MTCVRCGEREAVHKHHRKMRSQGGDNSPENIVDLCLECHGWVHANPAAAYESGWLVKSWQEPAEVLVNTVPVAVQTTLEGGEVPHAEVVGEKHDHDVKPGETCPTCKRRVNHAKKKDSPESKVFGYRVPIDDAEAHEEILEAAALELDPKFTEKKHWKWTLVQYAVACVLQGARLEEQGS